ncbi:Peptidase S24-like [Granulicatella balaenopterae]|uniref:Peptidase S24-like n=1 Tax=Granulicatella balaenopterae TaxID=137733 RepID=A0A1H9LNG8_9LACT|nr:XRE family transcriptional regulator [Granulicatella balaenopterae]SER12769.1 Peptidase S24-like [Granulicatella balaenopterae]
MAKNSPQDLENKKYFSQQLNYLLETFDKRQIDLHRDLNIPKSTLTGYVKGTSLPTKENVQKLAKYFDVKQEDLDQRFQSELNHTPIEANYDDIAILTLYHSLDPTYQHKVLQYAKSQLDEQRAENVGIITANSNQAKTKQNGLNAVMTIQTEINHKNYRYGHKSDGLYYTKKDLAPYDFALTISGNAMSPLINDGDIVCVKRNVPFQDGLTYIIDINGKTYCRKIYQHTDTYQLVANNTALFMPRTIRKNEQIKIIGQVVDHFIPEKLD